MAVNYVGKKPAPPKASAKPSAPPPEASDDDDPPFDTDKPASKPKAAAPAQSPKPKAPGLKFIKRGQEAAKVAAQEEAKAEQRAKTTFFRFWLPKDGTGEITFLDGDLVDGILDIPFIHEHQVNMNGSWNNHFICTQDEEPCPICEGGGNPSYVGIFTVIDHSEYVSKKDNKTHKDNVKLFVAKRDTIKQLQKIAVKRGGLRGCRFDVSRTGDKSPSVGNMFDFSEKLSAAQLQNLYKDKAKPVNYEEYLAAQYLPASELRKLGFGSMMNPVGSESGEGGENYDC